MENGKHIGAYGGSKEYHSDLSYMPEPSKGSLFHCIECPEGEGATSLTCMHAVFEALPKARQDWLMDQICVHDYVWRSQQRTNRPPLTEEQKAKTPPVEHPAVIKHPITGRSTLYLSSVFTRTFKGVDEQESRRIINELTEFASKPEFRYDHAWAPGDMLIWDNLSTMHKAQPFDEENARRRMHRCTVRGERPAAANAA